MMKMISSTSLFVVVIVVVCSSIWFDHHLVLCASVEEQCTDQFVKVAACLSFATGKAASPTDDCCSNVKDLREHEPVCLCYIILQTHKGDSSLKQMGLQEAKLLQLPTICKLKDTSVAHCPNLLKLSPTSPDYAIFTNSSSSPATSNPTSSSSTSPATPSTAKNDTSVGFMNGPPLLLVAYAVIVALFAIFVS